MAFVRRRWGRGARGVKVNLKGRLRMSSVRVLNAPGAPPSCIISIEFLSRTVAGGNGADTSFDTLPV